jgi:hypothetical protein
MNKIKTSFWEFIDQLLLLLCHLRNLVLGLKWGF